MPIWTLQNLTLHGTDRPRLYDVSVRINEGVTALVGYSGAGKSSLLSILAGMERPDAGTIETGDRTATGEQRSAETFPPDSPNAEPPEHALPLFWAPETGGLWPHLTARQHLEAVHPASPGAEPGSDRGQSLVAVADSIDNLLAEFDLTDRQQAFPEQLSQGEQSRLSIVRALAARAAVLLFDEPLAHVDPAGRPKYWDAIRRHLTESRMSLVFATHEPDTVLREAREVICLNEGQVVYQGSVAQLYDSPPNENAASFLGPVNWFEAGESSVWLNQREQRSLRPERIALVNDDCSPIEVVASHFCGACAETQLRHPEQGDRTVFHRPASADLQAGRHVRIELRGE
ncbi:MAG: ATP-binding cassette domain-containing protein [Planctomycetaceae bacterium]